MNKEALGPAEKIIQTLIGYTDHAFHGRPGIVTASPTRIGGVEWQPCTTSTKDGVTTVSTLRKVGRKTYATPVGVLGADKRAITNINPRDRAVHEYRAPGIFSEIATWMYQQVADVWKMDNEFAARWASYAFRQEHQDLKIILAAFSLVQSRKGEPVRDAGKIIFFDEDYRDVGEAMVLTHTRDKLDLNPKLLLRIRSILQLPTVAQINRDLGFGQSAREAPMGRWPKAVAKWLSYREHNPRLLEGLVKAGFRRALIDLAGAAGYKPASKEFFDTLRWKQGQAADGRRKVAIGAKIRKADSWKELSEEAICKKIEKEKPNFKRLVGLLPGEGLTRAVMAAAIECGCLSNKDLIIATPTLEALGLLEVADVKARWTKATKAVEDMRAVNIATRVRSKEVRETLVQAADKALQKAAEEVTKNLRIYFLVDRSGSMSAAIEKAKIHLAKFLQAFPQDRIHICAFNTVGKEIKLPHASAAGVARAFHGMTASGGTSYASGVYAIGGHKPQDDEDAVFIFYGDEQDQAKNFAGAFNVIGFKPVSFGLVKVTGTDGSFFTCVQTTASELGIPCFMIDEGTFDDPYAIPRTIRNLMAATPVGKPRTARVQNRTPLVETIINTPLLPKPAWAV